MTLVHHMKEVHPTVLWKVHVQSPALPRSQEGTEHDKQGQTAELWKVSQLYVNYNIPEVNWGR